MCKHQVSLLGFGKWRGRSKSESSKICSSRVIAASHQLGSRIKVCVSGEANGPGRERKRSTFENMAILDASQGAKSVLVR